jgi:hypothetical protein
VEIASVLKAARQTGAQRIRRPALQVLRLYGDPTTIDPVGLRYTQNAVGYLLRRRLSGEHGGVGVYDPCFLVLRGLQVLIRTRILDLAGGAVVDDEAEVTGWRAPRRITVTSKYTPKLSVPVIATSL